MKEIDGSRLRCKADGFLGRFERTAPLSGMRRVFRERSWLLLIDGNQSVSRSAVGMMLTGSGCLRET